MKCLSDCPTEDVFYDKYSIEKSPMYFSKYRDRMIIGNAPSVSVARQAYGDAFIIAYVSSFVLDIAIYCGFAQTVSGMQIDAIAQTIVSKYHYLKITELMLCFQMAKAGELRDEKGNNVLKFYGTFSGDTIATIINTFITYRNNQLAKVYKPVDADNDCVPAASEIVAPLLKKLYQEMQINADAKRKAEDDAKREIIKKHNEYFLEMMKAREELNGKNT